MPPTLTYPGVYIVEVPSSIHTITGVAASMGAFFGQASQGPLDTPIRCQSLTDFIRNFGPPLPGGYLGQMVQQSATAARIVMWLALRAPAQHRPQLPSRM